ncbi:MarR family transcriptional regulator [Paucilactobacillus suebicus]|uniref:Transcriptional regulator n=1 Tax=Paucilactobacillus suebicus DSM 5007 = KCTC 3549 TaxID=1423807 RepID=A0A0R1W116_9LACO|nr:MarR family transcriptional regulator [Paucilactobacillus suebicus]KRM11434.1 transcriptional regulator [Paucilactobacillus suebicus DSM 5007 = KCTC 3549]
MDYQYFTSKYIAGLYRESKLEINSQFEQFGVGSTEGDILLFVNDNPEISQRDVAKMMVLDSGIVTRHLRKLEQKGLLQQVVDDQDARRHKISLTSDGERIVNSLQKILSNWWQKLFKNADVSDPVQIESDFEKLYQVIIDRKKD